MFKSNKSEENNKRKSGERIMEALENKELNSIISEDMSIKGDVIFKGKIRIDGSVEGNVSGDYFILGERGKVKGDVSVQTFICNGSVEGNVKAEKVVFKSTANLVGKVEAKELTVDSGAVIEGEFFVGKTRDASVIEASFEKETVL